MNTRRLSSIAFASALGTLGVVLACCSGGTDGGEADFSGGQFVGSDAATGSLALKVLSSDMSVSETSGFGVTVLNSRGQGVSGIKVSCDSEAGVAILEPASGSETTDSTGGVSGVIGCAAPGSYQLACRLPVGSNKRQLIDVKCRGPIPTGFTGFPGAGGGGLGGGSDTSDSGGVGGTTDGVRLTALSFADDGSAPNADAVNFSIDTNQRVCTLTQDTTTTPTPTPVITVENFFDTVLTVKVVNNTNQAIQFTSMSYRVLSAGALANSGSNFQSDTVSFVGEANAVEGGGGEGTLTMLAFQAVAGTTAAPNGGLLLEKRFVGASTNIPSDFGFKSVEVTIRGTNDLGDAVVVTGTLTLDFAPFNRC